MAKKTPSPPPAPKVALYEKLLADFPEAERKGASMPYTSLNGNMFSFLDGQGAMGLRLPEEDRKRFLAKYSAALCVAHGTVLKEYVAVPADLLADTKALKAWFAIGLAYAKALKPKPTVRKVTKKK
jgi:TfoX/Sxy family transcriptional regulator of competence genes